MSVSTKQLGKLLLLLLLFLIGVLFISFWAYISPFHTLSIRFFIQSGVQPTLTSSFTLLQAFLSSISHVLHIHPNQAQKLFHYICERKKKRRTLTNMAQEMGTRGHDLVSNKVSENYETLKFKSQRIRRKLQVISYDLPNFLWTKLLNSYINKKYVADTRQNSKWKVKCTK